MTGRSEAGNDSSAMLREIGETLIGFRERAGLQGIDLADKVGCSTSKISRLEGGFRGITELDATLYLANCGATRAEIDAFLELVEEQGDSYRVRPHGERLPDELRTLIIMETQASSIVEFEPLIVPGILQIEAYTRAAFQWYGQFSEDDGISQRVHARLARQRLLRRPDSPRFTFYIQERVLRTKSAPLDVMHEQILHLVLMASDRCAIQVITEDSCPGGVLGSPFRIMRFDGSKPIAYVESQAASLFLEDPLDLLVFQDHVTRLADLALAEGQSREWLAMLASEYDRVKGDTA